MSTDELWALHEEIASRLAATLLAEKRVLENRLKQLKSGVEAERESSSTGKRPYPTVVPKFRNPDRPSETWAGRGKTPRWLAAKLKSDLQPLGRGVLALWLIHELAKVKPADAAPICCGSLMRASSRLFCLESLQASRQYRCRCRSGFKCWRRGRTSDCLDLDLGLDLGPRN